MKGNNSAEERDRNEVLVVIKAFELLDSISKERMIGLSELARKTGIKKTTVARLLATLKKIGIVDQDEGSQKFFLTMRIVGVADRVLQTFDIRSLTRPLLEEFALQYGRTVILAVLNENHIVHVDTVQGRERYRIITTFGEKVPAHCTASGKAIMAFLPPEKRAALAGNPPFEALTPNTIIDPSILEQELKIIKQRGYAIDLNERFEDILAVAVPIFGHQGRVIGAVTSPRVGKSLDLETGNKWGEQLIELSKKISSKLGWEGKELRGDGFE